MLTATLDHLATLSDRQLLGAFFVGVLCAFAMLFAIGLGLVALLTPPAKPTRVGVSWFDLPNHKRIPR